MHQRPCIPFPKPPKNLNGSDAAFFATRYMLISGNAETPPLFFDTQELSNYIEQGLTFETDAKNVKELKMDADDNVTAAISTLTVMAMQQPTACLIEFDNKNALCVVGSDSSFYMIDLCNNVFYSTNGPEYDINTYVNDYGSDNFKIAYFQVDDARPKKKAKSSKSKG